MPISSRRGTAPAAGVGVERAEHEMARQRRMDRDARSFAVAHFADHHDVRVVAKE